MFLVHPTRLSKIFAEGRTHPCGNARHRQASKLAGRTHAKSRMRSPKMKTFEKEPTRKAVFRSGGGPPGVLLPFLTRGSYAFIPHCPTRKQAHTSSALRPSKSATPLEYQNHYRPASPVCNYFLCPPAQFCGFAGLFFHYQQLTVVGFARHHRQKASMVDAETRRHPDAAILTRDCVRLHCTLAGLQVPRGPGGPPSV